MYSLNCPKEKYSFPLSLYSSHLGSLKYRSRRRMYSIPHRALTWDPIHTTFVISIRLGKLDCCGSRLGRDSASSLRVLFWFDCFRSSHRPLVDKFHRQARYSWWQRFKWFKNEFKIKIKTKLTQNEVRLKSVILNWFLLIFNWLSTIVVWILINITVFILLSGWFRPVRRHRVLDSRIYIF